MVGTEVRTHWLSFSENAQDQEGLQQEKYHEEDQGYELVESVQGVGLVGDVEGTIPVTSPAEASVERDVTCSNEDQDGGQ